MSHDEELDALNAGKSAEGPRRYIDQPGRHYLKLVEYNYLDGSGHKGTKGPVFGFEVVDSPVFPKGDIRGKVVALNAMSTDPKRTQWKRQARGRECLEIVGALCDSLGEALPDDTSVVLKAIRNVDGFSAKFVGTVVRCDADQVSKAYDGVTKTFTNLSWHADDRE